MKLGKGVKDGFTRVADSLVNFVTGLGTAKDPREHTQFQFCELNRYQLESMYRTDWLARRIVDLPAQDATREWRQWTGDNVELEKIDELEKHLRIQRKVQQAITRARLYGGAALVLGVDVGRPEEELDLDAVGEGDLRFVVVCNRYELSAGPRIYDVESPYYTRPAYYTVSTPMSGIAANDPAAHSYGPILGEIGRTPRSDMGMVLIHPSRVIEFAGNELPDWRLAPMGGGWGDSVLQTIEDSLTDFAMIRAGTAGMINDAKMDVVKVPDLTQKLSTREKEQTMIKRFLAANMAKSSINTLLLDKEEEWDRIQTSFGGTADMIRVAMTIACAAGGVPESRVMGNAPSRGLAGAGSSGGEVDIRNYYDDIASQQRSVYKPALYALDRCLVQSALGKYDPSIDYEWVPLYHPTPAEKAQVAFQKAQTTQIYVAAGLINEDALRAAVISQLTEDAIYPGLDAAIDEYGAEPDEPPPPPEPAAPPPGMIPKGQFEANPFEMLKAQAGAKLVPPSPKPDDKPAENAP